MTRRVSVEASEYLLGLLVLVTLAGTAHFVGSRLPTVTPLVVAIVAGVVLVNGPGIPDRVRPGVKTHDLWLKAGIVLLGASLSLEALFDRGLVLLGLVALVVACSLATVEVLAIRVFGIDRPLRSLLAAGASICGVSAVVGVGGSVDADEHDIAYAAGTILLFDAITLLAFPWLGHALAVPDRIFGVWAGLSMFSTGPVVAAGMAYSETAGQWATLTKLTRNALLGVVIVAYSARTARLAEQGSDRQTSPGDTVGRSGFRTLYENLPAFLLGFLVVSVLASGGLFAEATVRTLEHARTWLFTVAFVGLGTELDVEAIRGVGLRPILVTGAALVTAAVLSFVLVGWLLG